MEVTTIGGGIANIIAISLSVATTEGRKERKRFSISASNPQGERRDTRKRAPYAKYCSTSSYSRFFNQETRIKILENQQHTTRINK